MNRSLLPLAAVLGLGACADASSPVAPASTTAPLRSIVASASTDGTIPGRYIVTLSDAADPLAVATSVQVQPEHVYEHLFTGFAGNVTDAALALLREDPRVVRIEQDVAVVTTGIQSPATWGIDRVDQRALPLSGSYEYNHTGSGVTAYIIDSGIRFDHVDFGGRARAGFDVFTDGQNGNDCNGHGTHVAGTVGGTTYGVAKAVQLVSVRVLDCAGSGSGAGMIAGMEWIAANAQLPAVANMSIGLLVPARSASIDAAIRALIGSGVTLALAAGNGVPNGGVPIDACMASPSANTEAIVVGASDNTDTRARFSNYGDCLDFFAPGVSVVSAAHTSATGAATKSGTSMAAPHAAGVAALFLQQAPGASPQQVQDELVAASTKGAVQLSLTTANNLVYSLVKAPAAIVGKSPASKKPCTPKRQREGAC